MYRVISDFADLQDNKRFYVAGDVFPRNGLKVSNDRLKELSTKNNLMGEPLIEYVPDPKKVNEDE